MKILFDQGTPAPLRRHLPTDQIATAYERGWSELQNGVLLQTAEENGFDLFITTDRNQRYQQNLVGRRLAILVRLSTSWPRIQRRLAEIQQAVDATEVGAYLELPI